MACYHEFFNYGYTGASFRRGTRLWNEYNSLFLVNMTSELAVQSQAAAIVAVATLTATKKYVQKLCAQHQ